MYWSLEVAVQELHERQKGRGFREEKKKQIEEFLGNCPIPFGPYGFLARHIASARIEDVEFENRCRDAGLIPLTLEYPFDTFVTNNPSKMRLLRVTVFEGRGKKGGPRLSPIYLVSRKRLSNLHGLPLSEIKIQWGERLVQFHHRTRNVVGLRGQIVDISDWLKSIGRAKEYYKYFLAAFTIRGILFESFESPGFPTLERFTNTVVLPAWQWVKSEFGLEPLIVRHPDCSPEEEEAILNWYPKEILPAFKGYL